MKSTLSQGILAILFVFMLTACGGTDGVDDNAIGYFTPTVVADEQPIVDDNDDTNDTNNTNETNTTVAGALTEQNLSQIKVVDVNGIPLVGAKLEITPYVGQKTTKIVYTVGEGGLVTIEPLASGHYTLSITFGGITVTAILRITPDNFQQITTIVAALQTVGAEGNVTAVDGGLVGSASGSVATTENLPIENAQVILSGGVATNGVISSAITNEDGNFQLFIAINDALLAQLLQPDSLYIIVSANGYTTRTISLSELIAEGSLSIAGLNIQLEVADPLASLYSEDFEGNTSDWTAHPYALYNPHYKQYPKTKSAKYYFANSVSWHLHTADNLAVNAALTDGLVQLAPNDTSDGMIPAPKGTQCFWFGDGNTTSDNYGSFVGSITTTNYPLSGGNGDRPTSGSLVSPIIDLNATAGAINLTFDTFWEIESVNPNSRGFDLMSIYYSEDNGTTWLPLAILNPKIDPISTVDRAPLPYSNTGFNSAPMWFTQEAITLADTNGNSLAGKKIQLMFQFESKDSLYNGFRGWMIDNIKINEGLGTYPPYNEDMFHDVIYLEYN